MAFFLFGAPPPPPLPHVFASITRAPRVLLLAAAAYRLPGAREVHLAAAGARRAAGASRADAAARVWRARDVQHVAAAEAGRVGRSLRGLHPAVLLPRGAGGSRRRRAHESGGGSHGGFGVARAGGGARLGVRGVRGGGRIACGARPPGPSAAGATPRERSRAKAPPQAYALPAPPRLPYMHAAAVTAFSALNFAAIAVYANVQQWRLPAEAPAATRGRKQR